LAKIWTKLKWHVFYWPTLCCIFSQGRYCEELFNLLSINIYYIVCTVAAVTISWFVLTAQVGTSILPYLKLWPVDTYVDLMMQVMYRRFRVTTLLENLEKSGNFKLVKKIKKSGKTG